jgi:hypothetical protein
LPGQVKRSFASLRTTGKILGSRYAERSEASFTELPGQVKRSFSSLRTTGKILGSRYAERSEASLQEFCKARPKGPSLRSGQQGKFWGVVMLSEAKHLCKSFAKPDQKVLRFAQDNRENLDWAFLGGQSLIILLFKKLNFGLTFLIRASFFSLRQPFISFSLSIASAALLKSSQ